VFLYRKEQGNESCCKNYLNYKDSFLLAVSFYSENEYQGMHLAIFEKGSVTTFRIYLAMYKIAVN